MTQDLQKKIDRAIKLIQNASKIASDNGCPKIEVAYSGGKDSDVILELTKMANVPYRAIYKNTTIDPPSTIKHAIEMGAEVLRPKYRFFELVRQMGLPMRHSRFCCRYLKEYKVLDYVIVGVRRDESRQRKERYKEPEICRVYNKKEKVRQYFPILDWDAKDVEDFIKERNIRCAPIYYDEKGNFHVERRLGCMCCPLASKNKRIAQFKKYPNMVKAYIRAGKEWMKTHQNTSSAKQYSSIYEKFVRDVFYGDDMQGWKDLNSGFLPPPILRNF